MLVHIFPTRRDGIRLSQKESAALTPIVGDLHLDQERTAEMGQLPVLLLREQNNWTAAGILARLYSPTLEFLRSELMVYRGIEVRRLPGDQFQLFSQAWRIYLGRPISTNPDDWPGQK